MITIHVKLLLAALLVLGPLASLIPTASAQEAENWEVIINPDMVSLAITCMTARGVDIGMTWQDATTSDLNFGILAGDGTFTVKETDISGAGTNMACGALFHLTGTTWVMASSMDATHFIVYISTDDGTTWVAQDGTLTIASGVASSSSIRAAAKIDSDSFVLITNGAYVGTACGTCTSGVLRYWVTHDSGDNFAGGYGLTDNDATPTGDTATCSTEDLNAPIYIISGNNHKMFWTSRQPTTGCGGGTSAGDKLYKVESDDGGQFWTTPISGTTHTPFQGATTRGSGSCTNYGQDNYARNDFAYGEPATATNPCDQAGTNGQGNWDYVQLRPAFGSAATALIPPAVPSTSTPEPPTGVATNSDGQTIVASDTGSGGQSMRIWYQSEPGTGAILSHEILADASTPMGGLNNVVMTTEAAYVFYANQAFGGRLEYVRAEVFTPTFDLTLTWCSAPGNDDFAFDFVEDVDLTLGAEDYGMASDEDDFAYLGKAFSGTTSSFTTFGIYGFENDDSALLAVAYSTATPGGTPEAPVLDKGDGESTGDFETHVEVLFKEVGEEWNIRFFYADGGALTQFGTAILRGDINQAEYYAFGVDTVAMTATLYTYTILDSEPVLEAIHQATLPGTTGFSGDLLQEQWYVGRDGGGFIVGDIVAPATSIDASSQETLSTCIWSLAEPSDPLGDPGSTPPDDITGDPNEGGGGGGPTTDLAANGAQLGNALGIGDEGGRVLLAIVMMLIFGMFVYNELHASIVGFGAGAGLGLVFSIFTGLMPAVVTFLLVLGGAVFVAARWFSGSGAAASDGGM